MYYSIFNLFKTDTPGNDLIYNDVTFYNQEAFVFKFINRDEVTFSDDAQNILDRATYLLKESFEKRKDYTQLHPEWNIHTWDAGWYQVNLLLKECMKDELTEFNKIYKQFGNRIRGGIFNFGFLPKIEEVLTYV